MRLLMCEELLRACKSRRRNSGLKRSKAYCCENGFNHAVNIACLDMAVEKEPQRSTLTISYFISGKDRSIETVQSSIKVCCQRQKAANKKPLAIPVCICYSVTVGSDLAAGSGCG